MPIERLRMRPWLENALNEHKFPGVEWVDEEDKIFRLPWKHASRNGWQLNTDASLFRAWAVHTGKYKSNDKPNPKTWKANFRCALNSLPDMEELTDRRTTKGNNAFKVYRIINTTVKKGYTSKKMKGRAQRKKRQLYRARSIHKQYQTKNNTESAQLCESNSFEDDTMTPHPQEMNGTHLVDHDYAVTRYFDIFTETTDDNMQEVFDASDCKRVKTEPLSPQQIRADDEYSLYEESAVDTKNIKTSCTKEDDKIMSDDEVIELIDELSSDNSSCSSVDAAMDELLDMVDMDPFENDFSSEKSKQRATSAPGMLQPSLDFFCPQPSKASRSKSSSDIQTMSSLTPQEFLLQVVSGKFEG